MRRCARVVLIHVGAHSRLASIALHLTHRDRFALFITTEQAVCHSECGSPLALESQVISMAAGICVGSQDPTSCR